MARLGDICIQITDGSHNPPMGVEQSNYLMLSSKNIDDDHITFNDPRYLSQEDFEAENKRTNIKPNDLLITIVGTIGRVAIVPNSLTEFCVQRSVAVLKPKPEMVYNRFLMYYLQNMRPYLEQESRGVAQKGIYLKQLSNLSIILPPLDEQRKIAAVLDKVSDLIAKRRQQLDKLDELIKARFVEMFGDPISNPHKWELQSLSNICKDIYGGGTPSKSHPEYFEGSIPWVSPKDMKSDIIMDSIDHITEEAVENSSTKMVPKGAVLMVIRSGILKHTLPVAIAAVELTVNQDMKAFIVGENVTAKFLMYYFRTIEADVLSRVRSVTADNIDFKEFQKRMVILPPIELQNRFDAFVEQTEKTKTTISESLQQLETLKKALMQEYFG